MKKSIDIIFKILILAFPFFLLNHIYLNSSVWEDKYGLKKFKSVPDNIEVGNLGSSHGLLSLDYDIDAFNDKICFNFALLGQGLDFDYAILRQFIDKFDCCSSLIVCISPFETNGIPDYNVNPNAKLRNYGFLDKAFIENFSYREWFTFNYLSLFVSKSRINDLKFFLYEIISKFNKNKMSDISIDLEYKTYDDMPYELKMVKKKELINFWATMYPPKTEGKDFNLKYLDSIVELCYQHGVNPIIVIPPIARESVEELMETNIYYDIFEFHNDISKRYCDIKCLNYIDLFFDRNTYFRDNNHLSPEGAREFSKTIYSDLVKFGYINQE